MRISGSLRRMMFLHFNQLNNLKNPQIHFIINTSKPAEPLHARLIPVGVLFLGDLLV